MILAFQGRVDCLIIHSLLHLVILSKYQSKQKWTCSYTHYCATWIAPGFEICNLEVLSMRKLFENNPHGLRHLFFYKPSPQWLYLISPFNSLSFKWYSCHISSSRGFFFSIDGNFSNTKLIQTFLGTNIHGDFNYLGQLRVILSFVLEVFIPRAFPPIVLQEGNHKVLIKKKKRKEGRQRKFIGIAKFSGTYYKGKYLRQKRET